MALDAKELSFNDVGDEDDWYDVNVIIVTKDPITDEIHGEQINNAFCYPIDTHNGATGSIFEEDSVNYVQKGLHWEFYYNYYDVYGDTDELTTILAHSTDTWTLCNTAPSFKDNPMVKNDNEFNEQLLEDNRQTDGLPRKVG